MATTTKSPSKKPKEESLSKDDVEAIDELRQSYGDIKAELSKIIIGQEEAIERMFLCSFSGHALLMGVPGLAKTLLVNSIAQTTSLSFGRIQFTPDLMPSGVHGHGILQNSKDGEGREFVFIKGPIFANESSPTKSTDSPKTQSALLEAMQEKR